MFASLPLIGSNTYYDQFTLDQAFPQPSNLFSVSISESSESLASKKRKTSSNTDSINDFLQRTKEVKLSPRPLSPSIPSISPILRKQKIERIDITNSVSRPRKERKPFSIQSSSECGTIMHFSPSNNLSDIFDFNVLNNAEQLDKNNNENTDNHSKNVSQDIINTLL
jgi:hypothetical protein